MKTLHVVFFTLSIFLSVSTFAQTEKGNFLLGGTVGFNAQFNDFNDIFYVAINPDFGYFLSDNLAAGASLNLGYTKIDNSSGTSFGFVPFGRYYFGNSANPVFFIQAQIGIVTSRIDNGFDSASSSGGVFGGGPGMAFFLTDQIAIEGALELVRYGGDLSYSDLGLRFGLQAYLGGGE